MDTSGYKGGIVKSVAVETDDPDTPEMELYLYAKIVPLIDISPKRVYFVGNKNVILEKEVKIVSNMDKPLKISPVYFDLSDKVRYEIKEVKKGKIYKIRFIKMPSNDRKIEGKLKLRTNYKEMAYINIIIKGYFRGE